MGETWRGIYPITAFVHDALRKTTASGLPEGLSRSEQTLLTACDFWFVVNSGALEDQLKTDAINQLASAQEAFSRIGAVRIASTLRAALAQLSRHYSPALVQKAAAHIEEALSRTEDRVDDLIARFAVENMDASPGQHTLDR